MLDQRMLCHVNSHGGPPFLWLVFVDKFQYPRRRCEPNSEPSEGQGKNAGINLVTVHRSVDKHLHGKLKVRESGSGHQKPIGMTRALETIGVRLDQP